MLPDVNKVYIAKVKKDGESELASHVVYVSKVDNVNKVYLIKRVR